MGNAEQLKKRRRGFTLIEAAIVLGVVGIVIGGVWVAASQITLTLRIQDTIKGITLLIENTRRINQGFSPNQLCAGCPNNSYTSIIIPIDNAGGVPKDIFPNCKWYTVYACLTPWPSANTLVRLDAFKRASLSGEYRILIQNMPTAGCINVIERLKALNLTNYRITSMTYFSMSIDTLSSSNVAAYCKLFPDKYLEIYFTP